MGQTYAGEEPELAMMKDHLRELAKSSTICEGFFRHEWPKMHLDMAK